MLASFFRKSRRVANRLMLLRRAGMVSAAELLAVLCKIEPRGNYETARRLRSTCGMVFRYAPSALGQTYMAQAKLLKIARRAHFRITE